MSMQGQWHLVLLAVAALFVTGPEPASAQGGSLGATSEYASTPPTEAEFPTWTLGKSTPGVSIFLREASRSILQCSGSPCTGVTYKVDLQPALAPGSYALWVRTSLSHPTRMSTSYLDIGAGGLRAPIAMPAPSTQPTIVGSFQRGVALRIAALSKDGSVKAYAEVFPFPIEARESGCHLWVELASGQADAFIARGAGYGPGEKLALRVTADGLDRSVQVEADASGTIPHLVLAPSARAQGKMSIEVNGSRCKPRIEFDIGEAALRLGQ